MNGYARDKGSAVIAFGSAPRITRFKESTRQEEQEEEYVVTATGAVPKDVWEGKHDEQRYAQAYTLS